MMTAEKQWVTPEGEATEPGWGPRWALWDFEEQKWDALPAGYNPAHEPCDCPEHKPDVHAVLNDDDGSTPTSEPLP